jgi:site-specific DNA-methyltransferase (adenine-specific)
MTTAEMTTTLPTPTDSRQPEGAVDIACSVLLDPKIVNSDCLIEMPTMPAQSVDAIISDLPYGTTKCKWDSVIPFAPMWAEFKRLLKPNGAIILTASQPFTSLLVVSNLEDFKYCWVWEKSNPSNIANCNRMVMKYHEDICVFYANQPTYNPQKWQGKPNHGRGKMNGTRAGSIHNSGMLCIDDFSGEKHPKSIIKIENPRIKDQHPTQKPVELMRYLIRTYTNPGDTVLDPCCGSGTTCLAAMLEGRKSIGIEKDEQYAKIAINRIHEARGLGV